jgi:hypothetical protein
MMNKTLVFMFSIFALLNGCAKPFQPPPIAYTTWVMNGVSKDEVIRHMINCGYPNAAGFEGVRNVSAETAATAEQCMFRAGFKKKNGYGGICSQKYSVSILACDKN